MSRRKMGAAETGHKNQLRVGGRRRGGGSKDAAIPSVVEVAGKRDAQFTKNANNLRQQQ